MTGTASVWLRSRRFPGIAALCLLVGLVSPLAADVTLVLPFINRRLPIPLLLVLLPSVVLTAPLCDRFGGLERNLPRANLDRGLAAGLAIVLVLATSLPGAVAASGLFPWTPLLALMTLALLAVVLLGTLAWLPAVTLGVVYVYVDFVYAQPLRIGLDDVGVPLLSLALLLAAATYIAWGPRAQY